MTDYPITRESHAAHTGPGAGWDLEWITVVAPTLAEIIDDVPSEFAFRCGNITTGHWYFARKAPLSPGICPRCIPAGVIGGAVSGAAIGAAVAAPPFAAVSAVAGAVVGAHAHATAIAEPPATTLGDKPTE